MGLPPLLALAETMPQRDDNEEPLDQSAAARLWPSADTVEIRWRRPSLTSDVVNIRPSTSGETTQCAGVEAAYQAVQLHIYG